MESTTAATEHFARKRPGWLTRNVFNQVVALLTRLGVTLWGSRVLEVQGRKSGQPRRTPVNLLVFEGERYLVAPRGDTQWARNLRAARTGRLRAGPRSETFTAAELADDQKPAARRAYLKRWRFEVSSFFDGVGPDASEEELLRAAPRHPVFRISAPAPSARADEGAGASGTAQPGG